MWRSWRRNRIVQRRKLEEWCGIALLKKKLGSKKGKIAVAHNKNDTCETFFVSSFSRKFFKGAVRNQTDKRSYHQAAVVLGQKGN